MSVLARPSPAERPGEASGVSGGLALTIPRSSRGVRRSSSNSRNADAIPSLLMIPCLQEAILCSDTNISDVGSRSPWIDRAKYPQNQLTFPHFELNWLEHSWMCEHTSKCAGQKNDDNGTETADSPRTSRESAVFVASRLV